MSGGGSGGEKTEKATPKRRKQARKDGQIGNTPEAGAWAGMLVASYVLPNIFRSLMASSSGLIIQLGGIIENPDPKVATKVAGTAVVSAMKTVLPLSIMIALIGVVSVAAQGGLYFSPKAWKPKFSRMNPLQGIKRVFGPHGLWNLIKSLIKTALLAVVVYTSIRKLVPTVMGSGALPISDLLHICIATVLGLIRYAAIAGLAMAAVDFVVVRRRNNKSLKMTKQEIKEEYKSQEGDPHIRAQRKARQMALRRNRMMADVPKADVVLVNPTHVAVALKYDPSKGAPRVVAKGADHVAARIRAVAEQHRIPMIADVPLARSLYKEVEIGQEIPAEMYRAVATVLAFIMTLRKRGSTAGLHTVRTLAPA
jgi:flagellar biosynthetic protein FlhB